MNDTGVKNLFRFSDNDLQILKTNAIIFLVLDFILILATLLANGIFMITLIKQKTLHTPSNMLLGALCFSDLFIVLFVEPIYWANYWEHAQNIHRNGNAVFKRVLEVLVETSFGVSFTFVILISLDRYFALVYPKKYQAKATCKTHLCIPIISAITFASLFRMYMFFLEKLSSTETYLSMLHYVRFIRYILPFALILFCYTKIYIVIVKKRRVEVAIEEISDTADDTQRSDLRRNKQEETKAGTIAIILVCFYLCYVPNFVVSSLNVDGVAIAVAIIWTDFILFASSLINPIVYYLRSTEIRNAAKRTISLCCKAREATGN